MILQERFKTITTAHYRNAMGILLVYDITNDQVLLKPRPSWEQSHRDLLAEGAVRACVMVFGCVSVDKVVRELCERKGARS